MSIIKVIGVDPGPVTGICELWHSDVTGKWGPSKLIQADVYTAIELLSPTIYRGMVNPGVTLAAEAFVDGRRSGRVAGRSGSDAARRLLDHLRVLFGEVDPVSEVYSLQVRSAGHVKPWASAVRLAAAGITIENPTTMRHALDAGRHALYSACFDRGCRDPLAKSVSQ
jgi:hypothetical protein